MVDVGGVGVVVDAGSVGEGMEVVVLEGELAGLVEDVEEGGRRDGEMVGGGVGAG